MTEYQELMLSVCFGGMVGLMIGNLIAVLGLCISEWKDKRCRRKLDKELAERLKETKSEK
ncbi:MAG: hypothetical protein Q4C61_11840 [Lachnospiraceae bacterium]|nr:hypothetical protein [Lachnospiraceae bacterium]